MVKLATIFVDWSSRCHGNHSRYEIQRRGPIHPVTKKHTGKRPKTSDMLLLVIIYSLSCCVKPIRLTFFRGTEKEKL